MEVKHLPEVCKRLWKEELGQALTEYGLILGLIAIGVVSTLYFMREPLTALYQNVSQGLSELVES